MLSVPIRTLRQKTRLMNFRKVRLPLNKLLGTCIVLTLYWAGFGARQSWGAEHSQDISFWKSQLAPFLKSHCHDCHSGAEAEAGIDLDQYLAFEELSAEAMMAERPRWNQIRGMIKIGAMPPTDYEPRPDAELRQNIASGIHQMVNTVDCQAVNNPGRVTMRRLNNAEYDYSVRDLLAIDFSPSTLIGFPTDEVGSSFDNQGDVLSISDLQLEKYMQSAALISQRVLASPDSLSKQSAEFPSLYLGDTQSAFFLFSEGEYEIKPRLQFTQEIKEPIRVIVFLDDAPIETLEVSNRRKSHRINRELTAGLHRISLKFDHDPNETAKHKDRRVEIESVAVTGPPVETESYKRLMVERPRDNLSPVEAARTNLIPVIRKAYRREPTPEDIQRITSIVKMSLELGESFETALGMGLRAILVSPHFLFRVEEEDGSHEITDYGLASRLSYFLWSSIPDEALLGLARDGKLAEPSILAMEIRRMLADWRSQAIIRHFFGQYLGLGNLRDVSPDAKKFPQWNDRLRAAMQRETELVCQEIVQTDMQVDILLRADFSYINPRLAEHYSMEFEGKNPVDLFEMGPGFHASGAEDRDKEYLYEDRWIKVSTPQNRRGVLTHASVLTLTSNPTATSPVKRGKWIMETILGDPPPPAPPNVPSFEETRSEHKDITLREQLAIHRANPSCASCHDVMDPLGLGFENFDAIGRWRNADAGLSVDASGQLIDGQNFVGAIELIEHLTGKQSQIYRYFAEKLLMYALGRELEPYDQCAIDSIMKTAESAGYTFSSFVVGIVQSEPFLKRNVQAVGVSSVDSARTVAE